MRIDPSITQAREGPDSDFGAQIFVANSRLDFFTSERSIIVILGLLNITRVTKPARKPLAQPRVRLDMTRHYQALLWQQSETQDIRAAGDTGMDIRQFNFEMDSSRVIVTSRLLD